MLIAPTLVAPTGARLYRIAGPDRPVRSLLLLHGGGEKSHRPTRAWHPGLLRMAALGRALARLLPGSAVHLLRYSIDGWHRDGAEVLADAEWALDSVRWLLPDLPVVLIGHSLGGRVALRLGGSPVVAGVVALAPWAPPNDPVSQLSRARVRVIVGSRDKVCPVAAGRELFDRARADGADLTVSVLPGLGHNLLRGSGSWHRTSAEAVRRLGG